jgi:hypothetical protein
MKIEQLIESCINSKHGWAVAEQFKATWQDPTTMVFEEQNHNALRYIKETVLEILDAELLSEDAQSELDEYYYSLNIYLNS